MQGKTELVLRMLREYPSATAADMAGYVDFYLPSDPAWPALEARCGRACCLRCIGSWLLL